MSCPDQFLLCTRGLTPSSVPQTPAVPGPSSAYRSLAPLSRLQAGVASREQVLAHGVSDRTVARLLANEQWHRLRSGIYLTTGAEPSFESLALHHDRGHGPRPVRDRTARRRRGLGDHRRAGVEDDAGQAPRRAGPTSTPPSPRVAEGVARGRRRRRRVRRWRSPTCATSSDPTVSHAHFGRDPRVTVGRSATSNTPRIGSWSSSTGAWDTPGSGASGTWTGTVLSSSRPPTP